LSDAAAPLFVYGTLRDEDVLFAVLGRRLEPGQRQPAVAWGLKAVFYPGRTYPALIQSEGEFAEGMLLRGLTPFDIEVLDAFEGAEYDRLAISVEAAGRTEAAEVYWPSIALPAGGQPWSFEDWRVTHKASLLLDEAENAAKLRARLTAQTPVWPQPGEF
jgi:gamma-glutamylcyclotransferase (GGCT)/AIG2-like uncharacterized protein YtfP